MASIAPTIEAMGSRSSGVSPSGCRRGGAEGAAGIRGGTEYELGSVLFIIQWIGFGAIWNLLVCLENRRRHQQQREAEQWPVAAGWKHVAQSFNPLIGHSNRVGHEHIEGQRGADQIHAPRGGSRAP